MHAQLPFGAYLIRVAIPVMGVLASVLLLGLAAMLVLLDAATADVRQAIFAAGVLSWMFGIGWGVLVNAKPLAPSTQG